MSLRTNENFVNKIHTSVLTDVAAIHVEKLHIASSGSHGEIFPVKNFWQVLSG